jgi:hypothetical protein
LVTCASGARLNLAINDDGGLLASVAGLEGTPVDVLRAMFSMFDNKIEKKKAFNKGLCVFDAR